MARPKPPRITLTVNELPPLDQITQASGKSPRALVRKKDGRLVQPGPRKGPKPKPRSAPPPFAPRLFLVEHGVRSTAATSWSYGAGLRARIRQLTYSVQRLRNGLRTAALPKLSTARLPVLAVPTLPYVETRALPPLPTVDGDL